MDLARLEAALRRRLNGFEALTACERLSAGASRETYRLAVRAAGVEQALALRRSEHAEAPRALSEGPGLAAEPLLIAAARAAGAPGPQVRLELAPEDGLGVGFAMDWIEGETLGGRIARAEAFAAVRPRLARQCGEILARLHAIDVEAAGLADRLARQTAGDAVRRTFSAYLLCGDPQPMIDYAARWLLAHLPPEQPLTLVHGDFRNGNLMVDPEAGVVAVLDWELAHIGDPERDLGWLCTRSWKFGGDKPVGGFGETDDLLAGYESVSERRVDPAALHFWQVFGSYWWAVGCLGMAKSFRDGTETSLERPAIGRRSSECQIDLVNLLIPGPARGPEPEERSLSASGLPRTDELLVGVRSWLAEQSASAGDGRSRFLARVAAGSIDIVLRELRLGASIAAREQAALEQLLRETGSQADLRRTLCERIRAGAADLSDPALVQYLRESVLAQSLVDQPGYAGVREAMAQQGSDA
jgi:aminoglycoside phosphotransferase (APT) family kinase protein